MARRPASDARKQAVLAELRRGGTRGSAAGAAGVVRSTFYQWLGDRTFSDDVEKAEAEAEAFYLHAVHEAVVTSWQAAAWWLERRKHQDYARHEKVEMAIDVRAEAEKVAEKMGLDRDAIIAQAEAIVAGR